MKYERAGKAWCVVQHNELEDRNVLGGLVPNESNSMKTPWTC